MILGTPGMLHCVSGSAVSRFSKFSCFCASAHSWYGISLPTTTPCPAGMPARAGWSWTSHAAVLSACQMPCRSGCPSAVRCGTYGCAVPACPDAASPVSAGPACAAPTALGGRQQPERRGGRRDQPSSSWTGSSSVHPRCRARPGAERRPASGPRVRPGACDAGVSRLRRSQTRPSAHASAAGSAPAPRCRTSRRRSCARRGT